MTGLFNPTFLLRCMLFGLLTVMLSCSTPSGKEKMPEHPTDSIPVFNDSTAAV